PEVPALPVVPFTFPTNTNPPEPEVIPEPTIDTTPTGFIARNLNGRNIGMGIGLIILIVGGLIFFKSKGMNKKKGKLKSKIDKNLFRKNRDSW
ncbi:hypothetical protein CL618_03150, partial [archaeon]|nr:hypothetical protein [archaeon]